MERPANQALPGSIQERAASFFGMSFSQVQWIVSDLPRQWGACAGAYGESIYVLPEFSDLSQFENLKLLGHELTHIAQQRSGMVCHSQTLSGIAFEDDPELEDQAWRLGERFARNLSCDFEFVPSTHKPQPVLQRAVLLGYHMLAGIGDLDANFATVVRLIDGGETWLNWACGDMNVRYEFANGYDLTEAIQAGLHGTPILFLPKLAMFLHPLTLLTLPKADFEVITTYETSTGTQTKLAEAAAKALAKNHLYAQAQIQEVNTWLDAWKMLGQPVFQAISLADAIALIGLNTWIEEQDLDEEDEDLDRLQRLAAAFAVPFAQSPQEFVDYFQFYFTLAMRNDWLELDENEPGFDQANQLLAALVPYVRLMLRGAILEARPSTEALENFICTWQDSGYPLGFQRFSEAANQITQNTGIVADDATLKAVVENYFARAQAFIRANQASSISLSQNGLVSKYQILANDASAVVQWNDAQVLTLQSFVPAEIPIPSPVGEAEPVTKTKEASSGKEDGKNRPQTSTKKTAGKKQPAPKPGTPGTNND